MSSPVPGTGELLATRADFGNLANTPVRAHGDRD